MLKNCERCNKEIEVRAKTTKYCPECRIITTKEINKKYRDSHKEQRYEQFKEWKKENNESIVVRMQSYNKIYKQNHREERKIIAGVLSLSPILFYSGCFFMFYLVMPNAWLFFISYEKVDVGVPLVLEARISEYLSLVIQLMLAFGLSFQLPIVMIVLSSIGLISTEALKRKRRIAIVIIFVVAAILTPPDVFSQIALAIPLLLLYEFSILLCKLLEKKRV